MSDRYNGRDSVKYFGLTETFRRGLVGVTLGQLLKVDWRTWERSDIYYLHRRSLGYHDGLRLVVRDRGRPLVGVLISRSWASRNSRRATSTFWSRSNPISPMPLVAAG